MVSYSDYIFLCGDIYIIWTSRNGNFWRSPGVARTLKFLLLLSVVVLFLFHGRCEQGLKLYTPQATLLTISSLLRHVENLVL